MRDRTLPPSSLSNMNHVDTYVCIKDPVNQHVSHQHVLTPTADLRRNNVPQLIREPKSAIFYYALSWRQGFITRFMSRTRWKH